MGQKNTRSTHETTQRAIEILNFIKNENGARVSDLIAEFDVSKSSMYVHLNTLAEEGLIVRENGQYWVGARFRSFSVAATNRKPSYNIVLNKMSELEDEVDAEVEFLVEESGRINVMYHSENVSHNRIRLHAHNTAAGKAILAELPDQRVTEILDQHGLPNETENSITDRDRLFSELAEVSEKGYAYNDQECFDGYHGIGAAVTGIDGSILGAITIGGPVYRIPEDRLKHDTADLLLDAVSEVESSIESNRSAIVLELSSK